jgi:hypothetical protein
MAFNSRYVTALIVVEQMLLGIIDSLLCPPHWWGSRCSLSLPLSNPTGGCRPLRGTFMPRDFTSRERRDSSPVGRNSVALTDNPLGTLIRQVSGGRCNIRLLFRYSCQPE